MERVAFSVNLDAAGKQLVARFAADAGSKLPDRTALDAELAVKGWSACYLDEAAIDIFFKEAATRAGQAEAEPLETVIGERRDGSISLEVSEDKLAVWLTLQPAQGGRSVVNEVRGQLQARGIVYGLCETALREALAEGHCERLLVAEGSPPQEGEPAHFDSLIEALRAAQFGHDEDQAVDWRDLGNLLIVHAGTPLMRRTPAVPGVAGCDVFGHSIPAQPVPDTPFASSLNGAAPSPDDGDQLVALIDGQPVAGSTGVEVNPVIEVEQIDMATGNISFDGTVQVDGDVKAGMRIRASGDVLIGGTLEAAEVVAGGNVVVQGGIVGRSDAQAGELETASVHADGSVQARFIEHGQVEARHDILVERAVRQSELSAGHEVSVGQSGSGQIMGGHVRARLTVRTGTLGASSGTPTHVQVGFDPYLNRDRQDKEAQRKKKHEDLLKVGQLLDFLDKHPAKGAGGVREKAEMTAAALRAEQDDLDAILHQLSEQMGCDSHARVEVGRQVHAGTLMLLGHKRWEVLDDGPGGAWRLDEQGEILSDWINH